MIVYEATHKQFIHDTDNDDIEDIILGLYTAKTGKKVGSSEMASWKNSLGYMAKALRTPGMPPDTGVAIELHLPQSSKRIDFTLTGHGESGEKNVVLIELKQWSFSKLSKKDAIVVTPLGKGLNETVHPSYQAWSYASLLEGFNEAVTHKASPSAPALTCTTMHEMASSIRLITKPI